MFEGIDGVDLTDNFYRSVMGGNSLSVGLDESKLNGVDPLDPDRQYRFNSLGFRGPEFVSKAELVTAGCSFTYGMGVSEDSVWSKAVATDLGLTHNNLAKPGASISWIVEKLFNYFNEFGHPKYLLCLFPDAKRFIVPADGKVLAKDKNKKTLNYGEHGSHGRDGQFLYNEVAKSTSEMTSISLIRRPYNIRDIYTSELGYYSAIRQIRILEQYCKATGIKLLWSTWDFELSFHLDKLQSDEALRFESYFNIDTFFYRKQEDGAFKDAIFNVDLSSMDSIDSYLNCINDHGEVYCSCYLSCHSELIEKVGEENFHIGTDLNYGKCCSHPGAHLHMHYAEKFLDAFKAMK